MYAFIQPCLWVIWDPFVDITFMNTTDWAQAQVKSFESY